MNLLVSVIIPTFNRASFLGETLDSVLNQTYDNWECMVVDDGSSDYTPELIEFYCEKSTKIRYIRRPAALPKGANSCRGYGYKLSQGDFIMWLDDDDLLHKEKLEKQVEVCRGQSDCLSTCAWGRYTAEGGYHPKELEIYQDYQDPLNLLKDYGSHGFFPSHAFLVSRPLIEKAGNWRRDLLINQDAEFFSRVIAEAKIIKFAAGTHVKYREHVSNKTSTVDLVEKGKDLVRSWNLIESNIPVDRRRETKRYIRNGRKHAYNLLKEAGFKSLIYKNWRLLGVFILRDVIRKIKRSL